MPPEWIHSISPGPQNHVPTGPRGDASGADQSEQTSQQMIAFDRDPADNEIAAFDQLLRQRIGSSRYRKWFADLVSYKLQGDVLTIGVKSPFLIQWMVEQFKEAATMIAQQIIGLSAQVRFEVDTTLNQQPTTATEHHTSQPKAKPNGKLRVSPETTASAGSASQLSIHQPGKNGQPHDDADGSFNKTAVPQLTAKKNAVQAVKSPTLGNHQNESSRLRKQKFAARRRRFARLDDFVTTDPKHVPLAMARMISQRPGEQYNPLYLYGNVGIGKTHLLEGIHVETRLNFPELTATYLTAEAFANFYTKALREKTLPAFRRRFRSVDLLIVDDIEFLDAKRGMQEEFCHTIQDLLSYGRQVVLAADRHPRMLTNIRPDLSTRFMSGLVTRIDAPDQLTRQEILRRQAQRMNLAITEDAIDYISRKFSRNVRELIGALNCLKTYHQLTKRAIGITATRQVLKDLERDCLRIVRSCDIQNAVCELFGITVADLISSRRTRNLAQPRMLAMYLTRQWTQAAYQEIGQQFGGRNHSTVISAERKFKQMIASNASIQVASRKWTAQEVIAMLEEQLQVG